MTATQTKSDTTTQQSISNETVEQLTELVKEKYPDASPDSLEDLLSLLCPLVPESLIAPGSTNKGNSIICAVHDALLTIPK